MNFIILHYFVLKYIILNSVCIWGFFTSCSLFKRTSLFYSSEHAKIGEKLSFRYAFKRFGYFFEDKQICSLSKHNTLCLTQHLTVLVDILIPFSQ